MRFLVRNREDTCKHNPVSRPHAIISITTPGDPEADVVQNDMTVSVLRLSFNDLDKEPGPGTIKFLGGVYRLFDRKDAGLIKEFIIEHALPSYTVMVHCDAGISRSAAVAAALSKVYNGDDFEFFTGGSMYGAPHYAPNMLVYKTLLEAYGHENPA